MTAPLSSNSYQHNISNLRNEVLHLLVDQGLAGAKFSVTSQLAADLSAFSGRAVSRASLSMALSGGRVSPRYFRYLSDLKSLLEGKQPPCVTSITTRDITQAHKEE